MKATQEFVTKFGKDMKAIAKAEASVRELLGMYSRDLLDALHNDKNDAGENICDIRFINELLATLKTTNLKVAVLFFKHFTGFRYDEELKRFTAKEKANYQAKADAAAEFLDAPHNNIWTWADRNIEIEAKAFDPKKVTAYVTNAIKKAENDGFTKADVIKAVMAGGMTREEIADVLGFDVAVNN